MSNPTNLYLICIALLLCVKQIRSESVSKEGLREEHLLPVRIARAAADDVYEGSGDEDAVPIKSMNSNVMERMIVKPDEDEDEDNRVVESSEEDKKSIETIEEGSGYDDGDPKTAAILEKNITTTETTTEEITEKSTVSEDDETTTTVVPTETTTIKETTITTTETETTNTTTVETTTVISTQKPETTTMSETTTEDVETESIIPTTKLETTTETEVTEIVDVKILPAETQPTEATTLPEKTPVTEVVEVKHVGTISATKPEDKTEETLNGTLHENLTAGTDTLLMKINSRLLDANEAILDNNKDPSRLGTYIVVSLILLSFLSLIGFILMKRRVHKRRKKSNLDQEALDTEKALLSLSEYKDHPDGMDEGKIKNNEITPIVIKSNSQINKFEKNTNFSSPKNINTKANEKNVEKDNVLKDNLTQAIIEDAAKDVEEDKAEKLIVRTHLDQDSIPKKPVIVNRTSIGCVPVSQE